MTLIDKAEALAPARSAGVRLNCGTRTTTDPHGLPAWGGALSLFRINTQQTPKPSPHGTAAPPPPLTSTHLFWRTPMSDDDLIRRGDVLRAADEELRRYGFTAAEGRRFDMRARLAALPPAKQDSVSDSNARGVGVVCTWPSCGHTAKDQCQPPVRFAALDPALAPTDAAQAEVYSEAAPVNWEALLATTEKGGDAIEGTTDARPSATSPGVTAGADVVAWQSTTEAFIPFVTDARYRKFSPAVQKHYVPYRCPSCADAAQAREAAMQELIDAYSDIIDYGPLVLAKKDQWERVRVAKEKLKEART